MSPAQKEKLEIEREPHRDMQRDVCMFPGKIKKWITGATEEKTAKELKTFPLGKIQGKEW